LEENFTKIHVLNRAQLIDDSFHFVLLKKLDVRTYWDITKFLSKDTDYIAWYPMFKTLEYMSPIFIFHDDRIWHLKVRNNNRLGYIDFGNIKYCVYLVACVI